MSPRSCIAILMWLCTIVGSYGERRNYLTSKDFAHAKALSSTVPNGTVFDPPNDLVGPVSRNAFRYNQWPGARVPYTLDPNFDDSQRAAVAKALDNYHRKTCVRFVPRESSDNDYVQILRDDNTCGLAQVCKAGGAQYAKFGGSCINSGVMTHELGHTLCFGHEQSRSDRDQYIEWDTSKCQPHGIDSADSWTTLDLLYDYVSLQHYEGECYNGCIKPKQSGVTKCGSGGDLSVLDVEKINAYYNCGGCYSYRFRPKTMISSSDNVVAAGRETNGETLSVCRAYVNGDIIPGKANTKSGQCWLPYGGGEVKPSYFEILTNPKGANLRWIKKSSDGSFPSNAIPGGRSSEREAMYIGRCTVQIGSSTTTVPGKIHRSASSNMYYAYGGQERQCSDYEILVCS